MVLKSHDGGSERMAEVLSFAAGEGELVWYDGGLITFKASGAQTEGTLLLFEALMPGGKATPLHVHRESDETFYVIEGEVRTHIGGVEGVVRSGGVAMVPRGTPHAFAVTSESARLLVMMTPASAITEAFFREAGKPAAAATLAPSGTPVEQLMGAAQRTGLEVLGPPPFAMTTDGASNH